MTRPVTALLAALAAGPAAAADPKPAGPRFALLVGVDKYPHLAAGEQLQGAVNDVALMRQLLLDRFGFAADQVTTLTDEKATGAAVRAALDRLAAEVGKLPPDGPPVPVVFHFSGHGSQVPDQEPGDPDRDEDDGLDETLVPSDATKQGGPEDVRDDELNRFLHRVCAHPRARLWVVLDCCHSGTGTRAGGVETRFRILARGKGGEHRADGAGVDGAAGVARKALPARAVVLTACRASEVEPEYREDGKTYGLLTRFVAGALSDPRAAARLTYARLKQTVELRYAQEGLMHAPSPQLEGAAEAVAAPVLGAEAAAEEPLWKVEPLPGRADRVRVLAGRLQGLADGAVCEMFATPKEAAAGGPAVGWVRVAAAGTLTAEAEVIAAPAPGDKGPVPAKLPDGFKAAVARVRFEPPSAYTLRLRVVRVGADAPDGTLLPPDDPAVPAALRRGLVGSRQPGEREWFVWLAGPGAECDAVLKVDGGHAALFPHTGLPVAPAAGRGGPADPAVPASLRGGWGPFDLSAPDAAGRVKEALRRVAQARNLLRLAAEAGDGSAAPPVAVDLGKVELDANQSVRRFDALPRDRGASAELPRGAVYAYRLTNGRDRRAYVTVLAVTRDMGVEVVFPHRDGGATPDDAEVPAGKARYTDAFEVGDPGGPRSVVVLATSEPVDFGYLAQPELRRVQQGGAGKLRAFDELAAGQVFFRPMTHKGMTVRKRADEWSVSTFRWFAGE